jgi:hypothetical protein
LKERIGYLKELRRPRIGRIRPKEGVRERGDKSTS